MWNICELASTLSKHSIFQEEPQPRMLLPGHAGGATDMNNIFGLLPTRLTWDSKVTFTQGPFWSHGSAENFKIMTWTQDLPPSFLICPYGLWPGKPSSSSVLFLGG